MTNDALLDKITEIKQLVQDAKRHHSTETMKMALEDIEQICQAIEIDYQIEKRLNNDAN